MTLNKIPIILGSSSPRRLKLLEKINIKPDHIFTPDIDETPHKGEKPNKLAIRLAQAKMEEILKNHKIDGIFITSDNVVSVGNKLLDKAHNKEDVEKYLRLYSGKKCTVYNAINVALRFKEKIYHSARLNTSFIKVKRLSEEEISEYVKSGSGIGIAGGCSIEGLGSKFFIKLTGSYSAVTGLQLYETALLIKHYQKLAESHENHS